MISSVRPYAQSAMMINHIRRICRVRENEFIIPLWEGWRFSAGVCKNPGNFPPHLAHFFCSTPTGSFFFMKSISTNIWLLTESFFSATNNADIFLIKFRVVVFWVATTFRSWFKLNLIIPALATVITDNFRSSLSSLNVGNLTKNKKLTAERSYIYSTENLKLNWPQRGHTFFCVCSWQIHNFKVNFSLKFTIICIISLIL